jgi:hypothetical protein
MLTGHQLNTSAVTGTELIENSDITDLECADSSKEITVNKSLRNHRFKH